MTIGDNIKKIRAEKKLSQKALGNILGVSQAMIAQYETGKRIPKIETVDRIANALDVPRGALLTAVSPKEKGAMVKLGIKDMVKDFYIEVDDIKGDIPSIAFEIVMQRKKYIKFYDDLNEAGQKKAVEQVEMLTKIPEYQKEVPPHGNIRLQAAHNDHADEPGELEKMRKDLETLKRPDLLPNAAHERTDIEYTEEDRQADEDMLD